MFATFTEKEQIECIYYRSYALGHALGQREEALQIVLAARKKYTNLTDRSLLLALLSRQIFSLCRMNRLDEALEVITEGDVILESLTAKERETGGHWIAFFEVRKGSYYLLKKDFVTSLKYKQRALALREEIGDPYAIQHSLFNIGVLYQFRGEYDSSISYYQRYLDIAKQMGNSYNIARAFTGFGQIYILKGEFDTALTYYQQALSTFEEIGSLFEIIDSLYGILDVHIFKGELDTALEYNRRFCSLARKTGEYNLFLCLFSFARISYLKGEFDTALDYVQQSLDIQRTSGDLDQKFFGAIVLSALIYHAQGEWDSALERLQQALTEYSENDIQISEVLFHLVRVVLDQNNHPQAQEYLTRLQQLQNSTPNPWIHLRSRLAEALVLKQNPRAREKFQAQTILEEIVKEEMLKIDLTALAMVQLCELLIAEVKFFGEPTVWEETKTLIEQLYEMAQDQHLVALMCEALLLQAKSAAVDGKLSQAQNYYEQARLTATEQNLTGLLAKVSTEQERFEAEFETWQKLIQRNVPLQERVNHARMEEYIRKAQSMLKMDISRELATR